MTLYAGFLLGTLFCGLSRGYYVLLAARGLTGAFGGILGGMALAIIADVFPEERRGSCHRDLDVGLRGGVGRRRADWHLHRCGLTGTSHFWFWPPWVLPLFLIGLRVLPPLRDHLHKATHAHPWRQTRRNLQYIPITCVPSR